MDHWQSAPFHHLRCQENDKHNARNSRVTYTRTFPDWNGSFVYRRRNRPVLRSQVSILKNCPLDYNLFIINFSYLTIRIMHHPKLYSWVHKKHHEWKAPIAVSVVYTTKTENLMITAGTGLVNSSILLYKIIRSLKI